MSFKLKQGRKNFPQTGRGITSKLAGPEDPPKEYTDGKSYKEYNISLKDSLAGEGLPIGNYAERFHNARSIVKSEARKGNISKEKRSSMLSDLSNKEYNTLPNYKITTKHAERGYAKSWHYEPNRNLDKGEVQAEKILMSLENPSKKKNKKK